VKVLVDTTVWSCAFRRSTAAPLAEAQELRRLITQFEAAVIGPIRQELLSGIKDASQFSRLRELMRAFPDIPIETEDYERAATFLNTCRAKGIQGSNTDFLLCAVAARSGHTIFTMDKDFAGYAKYLPVRLHRVGGARAKIAK